MYRDPLPDNGWASTTSEAGEGEAGDGESAGAAASPPRSRLARILREPLTHFVAIGIAIFVVSHVIEQRQSRYNVTLSNADAVRIANSYAQQYGAAPNPQQMRTMIDNAVREEIYLREGLALGLDRNDEIVRRRIAQKFDFLQQDQAAPREPGEAQLRDWYAAHRQRFVEPARRSFEQVYFAPDRRGDAAARTLAQTAQAQGATVAGDPFPGPARITALSQDDVDRVFGGTDFGAQVFAQRAGAWSAPLRSGFGWHIVRVTEARPARQRSLAEAHDDVRRDWIEADRQARNDAVWQALRARYTVTVPDLH